LTSQVWEFGVDSGRFVGVMNCPVLDSAQLWMIT
jgi:hypothetical protein